ncbi:hypothetical protein ACFWV1_25880 [Streptomyces sp. NPDC058700]|uniref:hypothetical protein n=1 Tax=Streptomyces sp. NPDC058700 TaxID=3346607 RepID=UPI003654092E
MGYQLKGTVYVTDPDTHQTVTLEPGTLPEPRLAALVTNPAAWVDGKMPRLKTQTKPETGKDPDDGNPPPGDDPDGASGDSSGAPSGDGDTTGPDKTPDDGSTEQSATAAEDKPAARTAAKKTAARKQAETADKGTGGQ